MASSVNELHLLSKIATNNGHGEDTPYFDGWKAYDSNPYHPTQNQNGVIQLGLSENQLCLDLIEEWLKAHPEASICTPEGVSKFKDIAIFQDYHGLPTFRKAVANFMEKVRGDGVKIDPDRIVMSGGATGAMDLISFCLADPGDAFLIPTPYYPAFDRDLRWRTGVQLLPIVCESSNNFKITRAALEGAYSEAQKANINVKGLIITNPSNPLGTLMDKETLKTVANFTNQKNIHLVCDEIYSATVFTGLKFTSISEILLDQEANYNKNLFHMIYSLSKDLGLPGFRVGVVYSYNDAVVNCARKMSSFGMVSTQTQHLIATMLSDDSFVEKYIAESAKMLGARHKVVTEGLAKVGINCLKGNAGLFCWMDLRWLLREGTVEGETALWRIIVNEVKLNVSPGSSFHCSEPGWFRVCFANMDDKTVEVALQRIQNFVAPMKNRRWKAGLRLSFLPKRLEDVPKTPCCIMSPHSPLTTVMTPHGIMSPHSPIIHAIN